MKYGMPKDRLYVTYFGGEEGLESDEETRQFWLNKGYVMYMLLLSPAIILKYFSPTLATKIFFIGGSEICL